MDLKAQLEKICPADEKSMEQAGKRWKAVAKPLHSLGRLEDEIIRIAGMKKNPDFRLGKKALVIMCADNGVVAEGVTQTGQEVTAIVAENFTRGAASVCMMARQAGVDLFPVDIGMASDVPGLSLEYKIARGTDSIARGPAMTADQAQAAILNGIRIAGKLSDSGYELIATGEMGIGNTTTSSAAAAVLLHRRVEEVTGKGAGLSARGLARKIQVIRRALQVNHPDPEDPLDILSKTGGLDIAGLVGVFLGGAVYRIPVVIDGFISSVAALCAARIAPAAVDYMLPSHRSGEPAGGMVLDALGLSPLIDCGMCLGEGSGAVAVVPLLEMALAVYREMSTFEEIHVAQYEEMT